MDFVEGQPGLCYNNAMLRNSLAPCPPPPPTPSSTMKETRASKTLIAPPPPFRSFILLYDFVSFAVPHHFLHYPAVRDSFASRLGITIIEASHRAPKCWVQSP